MDFNKKLNLFGLDKKSSGKKMSLSSEDKAGMLDFKFNSKSKGFDMESFIGSSKKSSLDINFNKSSPVIDQALNIKPGNIAGKRLKQQNKINMMYPTTQKGMYADFDKDGVPNILDCDPLDKFKQDEGVKQLVGQTNAPSNVRSGFPQDPATKDYLTGVLPGQRGIEDPLRRQELLAQAKLREKSAPRSQPAQVYDAVRSIPQDTIVDSSEEIMRLNPVKPIDSIAPLEIYDSPPVTKTQRVKEFLTAPVSKVKSGVGRYYEDYGPALKSAGEGIGAGIAGIGTGIAGAGKALSESVDLTRATQGIGIRPGAEFALSGSGSGGYAALGVAPPGQVPIGVPQGYAPAYGRAPQVNGQGQVLPEDAPSGQFDGQRRADGKIWSSKSEKWVKYRRKKYDKSKEQIAPAYYPPQQAYYPR